MRRGLQTKGREIRRASHVHDVLIALTARDIGATLITRDVSDHAAIRKLVDFSYVVVS
jgi:predicted nucleic acid-binding protein